MAQPDFSPETGMLVQKDDGREEVIVKNQKKLYVILALVGTALAAFGLGRLGSGSSPAASRAVEPVRELAAGDCAGLSTGSNPAGALTWSPDVEQVEDGITWNIRKGVFSVPLSYDPEDWDSTARTTRLSPFVSLEIILVYDKNGLALDQLEPLLHACGAGSDATCVLRTGMKKQFAGYAGFSFSQRGVGVAANPSFECDAASVRLPIYNQVGQVYENSAFTNCPCALPDGMPLVGASFADIDPKNATQVKHIFDKMNERSASCANMKKWKITGPPGTGLSGKTYATGKEFNFLEYSGTDMYAQDIEYFRFVVESAPTCRMSINGGSYGTSVGAVYASKYTGALNLLSLNGNMPPNPETSAYAEGKGMALSQAFAHLETICATWKDTAPCNKFPSTADLNANWVALMEAIRAGKLTAPTAIEDLPTALGTNPRRFPVSIGLVGGYLQQQMADAGFTDKGWTEPVTTLAELAGLDGKQKQEERVAKILNKYCKLPTYDGQSWSGVRTWFQYGVCVGPQTVGVSDRGAGTYGALYQKLGLATERTGANGVVNDAAVLGQDYFGRYTVSQAMASWKDYSANWGEMATGAFVGAFAPLFAWRPNPTPVQAGFRTGLTTGPLIIGNLYDPTTGYQWSNQMRASFPQGVMMTWQGVGHMLEAGGNYLNSGMTGCINAYNIYWGGQAAPLPVLAAGTTPLDGYVCRMVAPTPL